MDLPIHTEVGLVLGPPILPQILDGWGPLLHASHRSSTTGTAVLRCRRNLTHAPHWGHVISREALVTGSESSKDLGQYRARLKAYMAQMGLRSTDQRHVIVETFLNANSHVSIDELLAMVHKSDPRVGYATVYRTLKLLAECGVAFERQFGDGLTRFELADTDSHHDHLICIECASITEFEEPRIEAIQEEIARAHGFALRTHKHEMYGVCAACQQKAAEGAARAPDSAAPPG